MSRLVEALHSLHATQFQRSPIKGRHTDRHPSLYLATFDLLLDGSCDEQKDSGKTPARTYRVQEQPNYPTSWRPLTEIAIRDCFNDCAIVSVCQVSRLPLLMGR